MCGIPCAGFAAVQRLEDSATLTVLACPITDGLVSNYTGDEYYTDGLRAVLIIGEDFVPLDKLESLKWEWPTPKADAHGAGQH